MEENLTKEPEFIEILLCSRYCALYIFLIFTDEYYYSTFYKWWNWSLERLNTYFSHLQLRARIGTEAHVEQWIESESEGRGEIRVEEGQVIPGSVVGEEVRVSGQGP